MRIQIVEDDRALILTANDMEMDEVMAGTFRESDYDESRLSRIESKWKHFLGASVLSKENIEKEKDRVKELVSDISHQTKTPMANIRLYAELLRERLEEQKDTKDPEKVQENLKMLEEIDRQAEKLEFLIQSLTKMSRLESNIVEVEPKSQELSLLLDAAIQDVSPKAKKKNVEVENTYAGGGRAIYDMKWTKEALYNVLDNAVKYSSPGSKVIVSVAEYELYTAISVKDFGIGIKEEDTAKIFGRFYRAEEVQQEEGVGIGLYLTREILRGENGYIKIRSRPGAGSDFMLYLPRNEIFQNC